MLPRALRVHETRAQLPFVLCDTCASLFYPFTFFRPALHPSVRSFVGSFSSRARTRPGTNTDGQRMTIRVREPFSPRLIASLKKFRANANISVARVVSSRAGNQFYTQKATGLKIQSGQRITRSLCENRYRADQRKIITHSRDLHYLHSTISRSRARRKIPDNGFYAISKLEFFISIQRTSIISPTSLPPRECERTR